MQQSINLSVDTVVFGYESGTISVLLIKRKSKGQWTIPRGFVLDNGSLEVSVEREFKEGTGVEINYIRTIVDL